MGSVPIPLAGQFQGTTGVYRSSVQADLYDNGRATRQTVAKMCEHIRNCADDPYIRWAALDAVNSYGQGRTDAVSIAWACWWWVHHNVKFKSDDEALSSRLNEVNQLELLISPAVLVRMTPREGDCDDYTMLVDCMLQALGQPWRIMTVACDPGDPGRWSHVFGMAIVGGGVPQLFGGVLIDPGKMPLVFGAGMPMDTSHGKYPGWSVPEKRTYRLQVWNPDGSPDGQEQRPMNGIRGLHGYTDTSMAPIQARANARALALGRSKMLPSFKVVTLPAAASARANLALAARRRRRGVGDDSVSLSDVAGNIGVDPSLLDTSSLPSPSSPISSSPLPPVTSSGNASLINFLTGETSALTKIFGQSVAPQTTIQTPQGLLITGPSGAIAQTTLPAAASFGGMNLSSLLPIAIIGIVGIVIVKAVSK